MSPVDDALDQFSEVLKKAEKFIRRISVTLVGIIGVLVVAMASIAEVL